METCETRTSGNPTPCLRTNRGKVRTLYFSRTKQIIADVATAKLEATYSALVISGDLIPIKFTEYEPASNEIEKQEGTFETFITNVKGGLNMAKIANFTDYELRTLLGENYDKGYWHVFEVTDKSVLEAVYESDGIKVATKKVSVIKNGIEDADNLKYLTFELQEDVPIHVANNTVYIELDFDGVSLAPLGDVKTVFVSASVTDIEFDIFDAATGTVPITGANELSDYLLKNGDTTTNTPTAIAAVQDGRFKLTGTFTSGTTMTLAVITTAKLYNGINVLDVVIP